MRVFFDTNVLHDSAYLRKGYAESEAVIATCLNKVHEGRIAWHSLSNIYYLVRALTKSKDQALEFVKDLLAWADVASTAKTDALTATSLAMTNFEDALQASAALACKADVIVTRNLADFVSSPVAAMTPETFLAAYP